MLTSRYLLLLAAAGGFALGHSLRSRSTDHRPEVAPEPALTAPTKATTISLPSAATLPASSDTAESLLKLPKTELYPRLALWLLDASESEIAGFWNAWHPTAGNQVEIDLLIFSQWAKRNPQAMIEAARTAGKEPTAWSAWAESDPQAALAAVGGPGPMRTAVMQSMAAKDPAWALKQLETDPSLKDVFVYLVDIAKAAHPDEPRAQIEFLDRFDKFQAASCFKSWAKDDPSRALVWLNERASPQLRESFLEVTKQANPELLEKLAEESQPGKMKKMLEAAAFAHLAELDPEKALEAARKIEVPRLAAERLTQLGRSLVEENPQQALEILAEVFAKFPDAHDRLSMIRFPNGVQYQQAGIDGARDFMNELVAKDPQRAMESVIGIEKALPEPSGTAKEFNRDPASVTVARAWVERDQAGFLGWSKLQADPAAHEASARVMAERLAQKMDYAGSIEWSAQIKDERSRTTAIYQAFPGWAEADPAAAGSWLEAVELEASMKDSLRASISKKP
ncbi:hypothetical protein [Luteolibacter luteus]|uniref:Uncharacterized protein n=1 Tax=Luteolibacter luteus TaxID=2728835 RepID=A0A858RJX1_9BACT|nr:hypothetical protein [Luteolibacter luteus]QJE96768.1 hypothetical protein HHL09_13570 [Luteolibacter luteus]